MISEEDKTVLAKWASISRTLMTAQEACLEIGGEKYEWCANELEILTPVLDRLHRSVKEEIWNERK